MKILIAGENRPWAIERSLARALQGLGAQVTLFDWWAAGAPAGRRRLLRRPMWPVAARVANRALLRAAPGHDALLVVKGLLVDGGTVRSLRHPGRPVVCFNPDNPWNRSVTSYSRTAEAAMPEWDAYLIWSRFLISRLYTSGVRRAEIMRFAWDPELHPYHRIDEAEEVEEIAFVGNFSPHREWWVRRLSDLPLRLYGPRWAQLAGELGPTNLRVDPQTPVGAGYAAAVARARVSLNLLDPHNCPGTNMRTYEVPGAGGVSCSTWTEDVEDLFPHGAIATFHREDDLRETLSRLMADPAERRHVRKGSHAVIQQHTFEPRARQILDLFADLGCAAVP